MITKTVAMVMMLIGCCDMVMAVRPASTVHEQYRARRERRVGVLRAVVRSGMAFMKPRKGFAPLPVPSAQASVPASTPVVPFTDFERPLLRQNSSLEVVATASSTPALQPSPVRAPIKQAWN